MGWYVHVNYIIELKKTIRELVDLKDYIESIDAKQAYENFYNLLNLLHSRKEKINDEHL